MSAVPSFVDGDSFIVLRSLDELFPVFENLANGHSVALRPPDLHPAGTFTPPDLQTVWLGVTSSGSTGIPKLIWRRWSELQRGLGRKDRLRNWTWAGPYQPWTFAGIQVALQAWLTEGRVMTLGTDWEAAWSGLAAHRVEALSATPTYLDLLIQNEPPGFAAWCPQQLTIGGEPLRPGVGARVQERFARARITVIYASAEFGVLGRTERTDGWYELESLTRRYPRWRVSDGALEVEANSQWRLTGDLIELRDDLFRIVGRADNVANVAGTKISLARVAELAEQVSGVLRAVAVAEPNPITGQIVCLRYAVASGADSVAVEVTLQSHLRAALPKEAWPRRWVVDEVGAVQNAKRLLK